jgi:hypothetical protein
MKWKFWSKKFIACLVVLVVLMLPVTAHADVAQIIQLLVTITDTLKGDIGQVLGGIQKVGNLRQNLQQQVAWPLSAINQAKSFVSRMRSQYTSLVGQIHSLEVASATLVNPRQLESLVRGRSTTNMGQIQPAFLKVYGAAPSATDANDTQRNLMDIDDAMAIGTLKATMISDQASEQMLGVADTIEQQSAGTAPGAAPMLTAQAQVANLQSQAFLQHMLAAELRQEATRLAHDNALVKENATSNRILRDHMRQILGRQ